MRNNCWLKNVSWFLISHLCCHCLRHGKKTELDNIHIHINLIPHQENHQKLLNLLWLNGLTRQLRFLVVMLVPFSYDYEKSKDYFFVTNQYTHPGRMARTNVYFFLQSF